MARQRDPAGVRAGSAEETARLRTELGELRGDEFLAAAPGSATWEWDLLTGAERYSAAATELVAGPEARATIDRAAWMASIVPEDRDRAAREIDRALEQGERWTISYRLRTAGGDIVDVEDRGYVVRHGGRALRALGVVAVAAQATPRADPSAARDERLYRAIVDFIPQLCWVADASGWLDVYNRRWYEYTGTTPAQMEGWGWVSVHDPLDLPRMLKIWRHALETGEPWEDEFRLRRGSDGALRWHLSRAMPLRDADGRIARWFGTNTDVHDQKLAAEQYERLLRSEQHLRRAAQEANRAKDEFLAVLSHELRTPLSVILNSVRLVRGGVPAVKQAEILDRIERNAQLQARLVSDILDVSRIVAGKLQVESRPVDLAATAKTAVEELRPAALAKGVLLSFEASEPAWVRGDPARLVQVVRNVVDNAVKFTPAARRVEVSLRADAEQVEVVVRDEGAGIAPEFLPRLFRRFTQADASTTRAHGGLGLGLSIVRELLDRMGGKSFARSDGPGLGSTFTIRLPRLVEGEASPPNGPEEPAVPAPLTGIRVLAVDDEPDTRQTLAEMLLACGATVSTAGSAQEALHALRLGVPDAIVSDLAMPGMDGYELLRRIRAEGGAASRVPAVALTAYASLEHQERALAAGFDAFLTKPADVARLSNAIAALCRDRLLAGSGGGSSPT